MTFLPTNKRIRNDSDNDKPTASIKRTHTNLPNQIKNSNPHDINLPPVQIATLYPLTPKAYPHNIQITSHHSEMTIGRSKKCTVLIAAEFGEISSTHLKIVPIVQLGRDVLNIVDLSTNGTFVNGNGISDGLKILKNGDSIWLGKSVGFIVRYADNETSDNKENIVSANDLNDDASNNKDLERKRFGDLYVLGKELGSGHYATVNEATSKRTGEQFAVKIFKPTRINDVKSSLKFQQELQVLMSMEHNNIVKLFDRFIEPINKFQISTYLVLEKVNNGELFTRIVEKTQLQESETRIIFKQLLQGLKYLHDRDIIHRDIKPENILLNISPSGSIEVKIADFGLAKFIGELNFTNTLCGTPSYVAPEVLIPSSERQYAKPVDMWSSGVLLYVCLAGFPPFSDELGPPSMREQIIMVKFAFYSPYFDKVGDPALDLISKLLVKDPNSRLTVENALEHNWLRESEEVEDSDVSMERIDLSDGQHPKTYTELSKLGG